MANNETPKSLPPPKLVVPRAEAAQKIRAQIEKGQAIQDMVVGSNEDFTKVESQYSEWNYHNVELLTRIFSNKSLADKYESASFPDTSSSNLDLKS